MKNIISRMWRWLTAVVVVLWSTVLRLAKKHPALAVFLFLLLLAFL